MAETLAEENSRLRAEISSFKSHTHTAQELVASAKQQLEIERREFNAELKIVKDFVLAFNAVNNAIISGRL